LALLIREYRESDSAAVLECIVALQEFERTLDPRIRPGETMAEGYFEQIRTRCRKAAGYIFVAELDSRVVGFVAVLTRESFTDLDDPPGTYALVTDLVVLTPHRRRGIGRQLLGRAEACARAAGATQLRIGVLAKNAGARRLYLEAQFAPHLEVFEKRLLN
jgi:GNAT superfamily N-acetyltransferase